MTAPTPPLRDARRHFSEYAGKGKAKLAQNGWHNGTSDDRHPSTEFLRYRDGRGGKMLVVSKERTDPLGWDRPDDVGLRSRAAATRGLRHRETPVPGGWHLAAVVD